MLKPVLVVISALSLMVSVSCKKEGSETTSKIDDQASPSSAKAQAASSSPASPPPKQMADSSELAAVLAIMKPYEGCREQLAADQTDLARCAADLKAATSKVGDLEVAKKMAAAANALAAAPTDDIEKQRLAFGEVSRLIEVMLTKTPAAAAQYNMYECPMAKGFKRWAQPIHSGPARSDTPSNSMANPYMGAKMLSCGSPVHDHHKGSMMKSGAMKNDRMMHGGETDRVMKHDGSHGNH